MKYLKIFEEFNKRPFSDLDIMEVENYLLEWSDRGDVEVSNFEQYLNPVGWIVTPSRIFKDYGLVFDLYSDKFNKKKISRNDLSGLKSITFIAKVPHPRGMTRGGNLDIDGYTRDILSHYLKRIHDSYEVDIYIQIQETNPYGDIISKSRIVITPKSKVQESNISYTEEKNLIIVDVQKSFKKWFTEKYVSELKKYSSEFTNVYQIWDNHHHGKDVDKDYLYDHDPEIPIDKDLYTFPNQKELIEKRYNYDVDVEFYKKVLDKETYDKIKNTKLKRGNYFPTTEGTIIVYIGNNHQWFHVPLKLYKILKSLVGKQVTIVGGSDSECLEDIVTTCESLGVNIKRDWKYIYTASSCPIS